ncbi:hypothetical protein [Streptomyces sp. NP-1717]|uniref:hypothetical protein n=1 Tax=unclassified Streptomyces TaxID=2593676 RepID=UPI001F5C44BC|nr:hypothetical protein [Streptomyces sp. NP-1717]MCI3221806.1 hypothetical protein [Streptomyces sp. NP-1717]WTA71513.1 hypothetical protein OG705_00750 [Streptomyces sp. NBC_00838]
MTRLFGGRITRVVLAALAGCGAGVALHAISKADGSYAFAVIGAVVGVTVALATQFYRSTARLTEVRITVPQLSELTFVVNNDAQQVAWQLFVESVTRTSTQRLGDDEGLIREALTSLYGLFATTRDTLKASRPSTLSVGFTVENLAVTLLNRELRPFLSKWHPLLREFENANPDQPESVWPRAAECRAELRQLQTATREYVLAFAKLAGVQDPHIMLGTESGD